MVSYSLKYKISIEKEYTNRNVIESGQYLESGKRLTSRNKHFHLWMQDNGDLELYMVNVGSWNVIWASMTIGSGFPPYILKLNKETNELEIHSRRNKLTWKSGVSVSKDNGYEKGGYAILKNNGDFVIYDRNNVTMWSSGTKGGEKSHKFGTGVKHGGKFFSH